MANPMHDELIETKETEPVTVLHRGPDGEGTLEYLAPRMDAALAVNVAILEQPNS